MSLEENPYLPPASRVADADGTAEVATGPYLENGRAVPSGNAIEWLSSGWRMFRRQTGLWVRLALVYALITIGLSVIPIIGQLAAILVTPIFVGGFMFGCRRIDGGGETELAHLFAGFRLNTAQLALVGVIGMALIAAVMIPVFLVTGVGAVLAGGAPKLADATLLLGALVSLALLVPVYMAVWFAPALVMLQQQTAPRAMMQSFRGCLKNLVPFLIYGLALFVLGFVAAIPFGLGWLVLGPVMIASIYAAYRDIYFA